MRGLRNFFFDGSPQRPAPSGASRAVAMALALAAVAGFFTAAFLLADYSWNWPTVWKYRSLFLQGWLGTLALSAAALPLSLLVGALLAAARRSSFLPLQSGAFLLVELVRGTPLLVLIYVLFYVVGDTLGIEDRHAVGLLTLALFSGAYSSEIFRAGIESVGRSQLESARAIGLTRVQTYRHVIIPQALRQMLPPLAGQFASLIKDSSLLSVIAIQELTQAARQVHAFTVSSFESFMPLAAGYLVLTIPLSLAIRRLEQASRYDT